MPKTERAVLREMLNSRLHHNPPPLPFQKHRVVKRRGRWIVECGVCGWHRQSHTHHRAFQRLSIHTALRHPELPR